MTSRFGNLTVTICSPHVPSLPLVSGALLNIAHYNTVLESISDIKIMLPNTVLASIAHFKNTVLGSTVRAINQ